MSTDAAALRAGVDARAPGVPQQGHTSFCPVHTSVMEVRFLRGRRFLSEIPATQKREPSPLEPTRS